MPLFLLELAVVIILIIVNGALAAAEMALVACSKAKLKHLAQKGSRKAQIALRLASEPDRLFPTVQVGISLVAIMTGAFSGAAFSRELTGVLEEIPLLAPYARILGLGLVVLPVTYVSVVAGELVPKRLAVTYSAQMAMWFAPPMNALTKIFWPAVRLLSSSTNLALKAAGLQAVKDSGLNEDEIRIILGEAAKSGALEKNEWEMLERIFRLGNRRVGGLMTHRSNLEWIDLELPLQENLNTMRESNHWIFPVLNGQTGDILGLLSARDLLRAECIQPEDLRKLVAAPLFVPENMLVLTVLNEMRQKRQTMVMVVDEYGDIKGAVTLRDIMKSVLGDLPSPLLEEAEAPSHVRRADGSWLLDGAMPFDEALALLEFHPTGEEEHRHFETLAGFVLEQLENIPALGEAFTWHNWTFEVLDMDGKRVDRVLAIPPGPNHDAQAEDGA